MTTPIKPPTWFWVVSVIALLWNLVGVFNYLNQAFNQVAMLESLNQAQREAFEGIPAWATAAFAIAVFSGTIACIGLLLRKKWAMEKHKKAPNYRGFFIGCQFNQFF